MTTEQREPDSMARAYARHMEKHRRICAEARAEDARNLAAEAAALQPATEIRNDDVCRSRKRSLNSGKVDQS